MTNTSELLVTVTFHDPRVIKTGQLLQDNYRTFSALLKLQVEKDF